MQKYSTIIGVIELRQSGVGYRTTKKRYNIGNSTVTLIMNRFHELGLSLEELQQRAAALGAHAIVGVDMDYEVLGQGNMLMVTASGTAVTVEAV